MLKLSENSFSPSFNVIKLLNCDFRQNCLQWRLAVSCEWLAKWAENQANSLSPKLGWFGAGCPQNTQFQLRKCHSLHSLHLFGMKWYNEMSTQSHQTSFVISLICVHYNSSSFINSRFCGGNYIILCIKYHIAKSIYLRTQF